MQNSRQALNNSSDTVQELDYNLPDDTSPEVGHIYVACNRKKCCNYRKMGNSTPVPKETDGKKWIGVKVKEIYDPNRHIAGKKITENKYDNVAKYYCSEQCAVAGEL